MKPIYVLWKYPKILGIFDTEEKVLEAGRKIARELNLKEIVDYWTMVPYWMDEKTSIMIDHLEMNKLYGEKFE